MWFDSDIGFLPGDEQEKISPLMRPIMDNLEQLIVCADDAMYQVKKNGKNDFAFYKKPEEETTDNTQ